MIKAIDISHHNGDIDFKKVKASGIDSVIIRTGYGLPSPSQVDKKFKQNYERAREAGMKIGAYHYSYAKSSADAEKEAEAMLSIIGNKKFELPLFYDIEESTHAVMDKKTCGAFVRAFCNKLEENGKWAGVYSYDAFFGTNLEPDIVGRYTTWVARVENIEPTSCKRYDIWQYSWKGSVPGIKGNVDMNYIYKDFPAMMQKAHLNGF